MPFFDFSFDALSAIQTPQQSLGAGNEVYNCMECPNNCIGGSETSCPASSAQLPPPAMSWYPAVGAQSMAPTHQIAYVLPVNTPQDCIAPVRAAPGHLVLAMHALGMAAVQGVLKGDFKDFSEDAATNASSVSELSGYVVSKSIRA